MAHAYIKRAIAMAELRERATGVTLTFPKVVVSGVIISHRAFIMGFAQQLRRLETSVPDVLAPLADELEELATLLPLPTRGDAGAAARSDQWVYLKHAVLITVAGAVQVGYWFGETADIAEYSCGELDLGA